MDQSFTGAILDSERNEQSNGFTVIVLFNLFFFLLEPFLPFYTTVIVATPYTLR